MKINLTIVLIVLSCTEKKSGTQPTNNGGTQQSAMSASFLTLNDFNPTYGLNDIGTGYLPDYLSSDSSFYNVYPKSASDSALYSCRATAMSKLAVNSTRAQLTISGETDTTACNKKDPSYTITKSTVKIYYAVNCPSTTVDLSQYNGKSADFSALTKLSTICKSPPGSQVSVLANYRSIYQVTGTSKSQTQSIETTVIGAVLSSQGGTCSATVNPDQTIQYADCTEFSATLPNKDLSTGKPGTLGDLQKIVLNNLNRDDTSPYYSGGSTSFVYNSWSGTLNYTGFSIPATWNATNSTNGSKTGGTLSPTLSLTDFGSSESSLTKFFYRFH